MTGIYRHKDPKNRVLGNTDGAISQRLKATIMQVGNDSVFVNGLIGEGTTVDMSANWNPVLADGFQMINGALELATGSVVKTALATTQVWQGSEPVRINLVLDFYALTNAESEVEEAIEALRVMASPELKGVVPISQVPSTVMLNLRGRLLFPECVIDSISEPYDSMVDAGGGRLATSVTLSISTKETLSKSDLS